MHDPHLDSILVLLSGEVALKDMGHVLLLGKLLPPHGPETLRLPSATKIEQIVILELTEGWGRGVAPATVGKIVPLLSSVDVTLWTHGPEYRTDVLRVATVVGGLFPWQRLEGKRVLAPHPETLEDLGRGNLSVQSVEMKTLNLRQVERGR